MAADLGYFGPDSATWRVLADPAAAVGGVRALFLQALHPRAIAAVHHHSSFGTEFWPRLQRTAQYVTTVGFGTTEQVDAIAGRVRAMHDEVRGVDPVTGLPYAADDPDLLRWVHVTEVASILDAVRRAGLPLDGTAADAYLTEQVRAAELVGARDVPATRAELSAYFDAVRPQLRSSPIARTAALRLTVPPMPLWVQLTTPARPVWTIVAALAFALQPAWARRLYGMPGLTTTDLAATIGMRIFRAAALQLPDRWQHGPIIEEALARTARPDHGT
ncbi:MAG: oxygenase MpaB family protein [Pseudonocardiaceae bacterium]